MSEENSNKMHNASLISLSLFRFLLYNLDLFLNLLKLISNHLLWMDHLDYLCIIFAAGKLNQQAQLLFLPPLSFFVQIEADKSIFSR